MAVHQYGNVCERPTWISAWKLCHTGRKSTFSRLCAWHCESWGGSRTRNTCRIPRRCKAFPRCAIDCVSRGLSLFLALCRKVRINIYASRNWACHREPSPYAASELICTCKPCRKRRICALRFGDRLFRVSLQSMRLGRSDRDDCAPSDCVNLRDSSIIFLSSSFFFLFFRCVHWMEILEALVFFSLKRITSIYRLSKYQIFIIE